MYWFKKLEFDRVSLWSSYNPEHCWKQGSNQLAITILSQRVQSGKETLKTNKQTNNLTKRGFPGSSASKESACNARDPGSIPGWGRSPGEGNGHPHQYSCLENSMDRGAWWATVHGIVESDCDWVTNTQHTHTHTEILQRTKKGNKTVKLQELPTHLVSCILQGYKTWRWCQN